MVQNVSIPSDEIRGHPRDGSIGDANGQRGVQKNRISKTSKEFEFRKPVDIEERRAAFLERVTIMCAIHPTWLGFGEEV